MSRLPNGYIELEYIESTGKQYIDTGIANNSLTNPTVEITLKMLELADTTWFGVPTIDAKGIFYNIKTSSPEKWYARWGSQKFGDRPLTYQAGKSDIDLVFTDALHTVKLTGTTNLSVYVDDELVGTNTYNSCAFTATGNIQLFGVQTSPTKRKIQLGMWKISNNDMLLQHLIPAKRISDSAIGMYDTVSQSFFTNSGTGNFIAGPVVMKIEKFDSVIVVQGKNLFDISTAVWCKNIGEDGTEATSQYNSHSDYIECKPNTTYTVSFVSNSTSTTAVSRYHEYDSNKTWLRQITSHGSSGHGAQNITFTTGATAKYIRLTFRGKSSSASDLSTDIQLEEGSTATPYEPYGNKLVRFNSVIAIQSKNLFDKSIAKIGYLINDSGIEVVDAQSGCSGEFIKVKPNTDYTYAVIGTPLSSSYYPRIHFYNANKQWIKMSIKGGSGAKHLTTTESDTAYIKVSGTVDVDKVMVVEGSEVPTSYEPYGNKLIRFNDIIVK